VSSPAAQLGGFAEPPISQLALATFLVKQGSSFSTKKY
jgi:hypothetical protein